MRKWEIDFLISETERINDRDEAMTDEILIDISKRNKAKVNIEKENYDWDSLKKEVLQNGAK